MREIVIATNNKHKVEEIRSVVDGKIKIITLAELGCKEDIPETGETLEENARQKARYIWEKYGKDCFADDTGLMVDALDGKPGVYSARFAGEKCSLLMQQLQLRVTAYSISQQLISSLWISMQQLQLLSMV